MLSLPEADERERRERGRRPRARRGGRRSEGDQHAGDRRAEPGEPLKQTASASVTMSSRKRRDPVERLKITLGFAAFRWSTSQLWKLSRSDAERVPLAAGGHGYSARARGSRRSHHRDDHGRRGGTGCATTGAVLEQPRGRCRLDGCRHRHPPPSPAIAVRTATRSTTPTTRPSSTADTGRSLAGDRRDGVPDRRRHVEPVGPSSSPGLDRPHDPAQREDVAARDVADEVGDVVVGGRADDLLRRADLDEARRRA